MFTPNSQPSCARNRAAAAHGIDCALRCRYYKLLKPTSGWTGCREGLRGRQRPRSKRQPPFVEAFLARAAADRAPDGRRRTNGHTSNDAALFHPCGLLGRVRTAERPSSTRQSALVAAAWPSARERPSPSAQQKGAAPSRPQRGRARAAAATQTRQKHSRRSRATAPPVRRPA